MFTMTRAGVSNNYVIYTRGMGGINDATETPYAEWAGITLLYHLSCCRAQPIGAAQMNDHIAMVTLLATGVYTDFKRLGEINLLWKHADNTPTQPLMTMTTYPILANGDKPVSALVVAAHIIT